MPKQEDTRLVEFPDTEDSAELSAIDNWVRLADKVLGNNRKPAKRGCCRATSN
jgi:hypothetical protein